MAMTQGGGGGNLASNVPNAREFIEKRLQVADSPMSPDELAREYGCGNQHTQNICSELTQEGVIERIEEGQYVDSTGSDVPGEGLPVGQDESGVDSPLEFDAESGESGEEESADPSGDGEAPSADLGIEGGEDDLTDRDAALAAGATAGAAAFPTFLEEIDTSTIVLLLVVVVVFYWMFVRGTGSLSEPVASGDQEEPGEDWPVAEGGVMG